MASTLCDSNDFFARHRHNPRSGEQTKVDVQNLLSDGTGNSTSSWSDLSSAAVPVTPISASTALTPYGEQIIQSYMISARDVALFEAQSRNIPTAALSAALNPGTQLYSVMEEHAALVFDLLGNAHAGLLDAQSVMELSNEIETAYAHELAVATSGLSNAAAAVIRSLVFSHAIFADSSLDKGISTYYYSPAFGFPPLPLETRGAGSLEDCYLRGGSVLIGGIGNDFIYGDGKNIMLVGGAGNDTLIYVDVSMNLDIRLSSGTAEGIGSAPFLTNIAGFENVTGGTGVNSIEGDDRANTLNCWLGTDNSMHGAGGNDVLVGGAGHDSMDGGSGRDTAYYAEPIFIGDFTWKGLTLSLVDQSLNTGDAAGDVWTSIENISGTYGDDTIIGDILANVLSGHADDDQLFGNGGNDTLVGGAGADYLNGGAGVDTASYSDATIGVVANLRDPSAGTNDASGDIYQSIENLTGSSYADKLSGNGLANVLAGGFGNDRLAGRAGNDRLQGGGGADDLYGGGGNDIFLFKALTDSTVKAAGRDTIFDFSGHGDRMDLHAIDANTKVAGNQDMVFIGTSAFHGNAGELRYVKASSDTYVYADVNGDRKADFSIHLDDAVTLDKGDFIL